MMYDYSTLLEHFTYLELWQHMESTTRRFTTTSSRNGSMCKSQANTEPKKFVNEGVDLHYISKE